MESGFLQNFELIEVLEEVEVSILVLMESGFLQVSLVLSVVMNRVFLSLF